MSAMLTYFWFFVTGTRCYAKRSCAPPPYPPPLAGEGREGVSWLNTALIEPSPYRDLSLEAKAAATIKRGSWLCTCIRTFTSTEKRNGSAVRPNARGDLVRWETHPEPGRKNSRPDPRAALCERRVRGRARLRGSDFQKPGTLRAPEAFRHHPGFRDPVFGRRDRRRQASGGGKEWPA